MLVACRIIPRSLGFLRPAPGPCLIGIAGCIPRGHAFGHNVPTPRVNRIGRVTSSIKRENEGPFVGDTPDPSSLGFDVVYGTIRLARRVDGPSTSMRSECGIALCLLIAVRWNYHTWSFARADISRIPDMQHTVSRRSSDDISIPNEIATVKSLVAPGILHLHDWPSACRTGFAQIV